MVDNGYYCKLTERERKMVTGASHCKDNWRGRKYLKEQCPNIVDFVNGGVYEDEEHFKYFEQFYKDTEAIISACIKKLYECKESGDVEMAKTLVGIIDKERTCLEKKYPDALREISASVNKKAEKQTHSPEVEELIKINNL